MIALLSDSLLDTVIDTIKLLPFLFVTYLVMEWLERKTEEHSVAILSRIGKLGPVFGAAVGVIPQCGFSAAASSLYSGGVISIGSILAVFLSTSDEMVPIFISSAVGAGTILKILITKFVIAMVTGLVIDLFIRVVRYRFRSEKHIHDLCEREHCGCEEEEGGIVRSALIHTFKIALFIFIISFVISLLVGIAGQENIARFLSGMPVLGVLLSGIIGLIPNCAASVMITQLYLEGLLSAGQMMTGLLVGAGVGILVLFRTNKHHLENLKVVAALYVTGVFWGLIIELLHITF